MQVQDYELGGSSGFPIPVERLKNVDASRTDLEEGEQGYGAFVAYSTSVNYILGVGVLGIPYAFVQAGYLLSPIAMFLSTLMALLTALWLPDIITRAEAIVVAWESGVERGSGVTMPTFRKHEINQLFGIFFGKRMKQVYEVCIAFYFLGALWSYASVFSQSLAAHVPMPFLNDGATCDVYKDTSSSCNGLYLFYLLVFALICTPITCMELKEMKIINVTLAIFRFVALGTMIATCIAAIYSYPNRELHPKPEEEDLSPPYLSDIPAVRFSGLAVLLPVAIYSQIFHHSVPGIVQPFNDKRAVPKVFAAVLATTLALYTGLGITAGLFYGSSIEQTATLNWAHYKGAAADDEPQPAWAAFISYLVVLFPPIDILSAFPLNAVTLANNLLTAAINDPEKRPLPRYRLPFRILAALLPCCGAALVHDLASILQYTGCLGVFIAFIFPCMLQLASLRAYASVFGSGTKPPTLTSHGWFSRASGGDAASAPLLEPKDKAGRLAALFSRERPVHVTLILSSVALITVIVLSFV